MPTEYSLSAENVSVARKGKVILNQVSFQVRPNTLTAMIGPNGAGKSTLMRALSGEQPTEGQVLVNGEDIYRDPEHWLRQIGYIPVDNILHENLTLQEAILYLGWLRLPHWSEARIWARADQLLTRFGFPPEDDRRQKLIKVFSSGELKRANLCAELINDPKIILLDEPTSNLDPDAEYELMARLAEYAHQEHKTILVITHTLNTIELCDEVIFIENGSLRKMGPPQRVLDELLDELQPAPHPTTHPSTFFYWAQVFKHTQTRPSDRLTYAPHAMPQPPAIKTARHAPTAAPWPHQFLCLFQRYFRSRLNDRWGLVMTLFAGLSGALFFTLPGSTFVMPFDFNQRVLGLNQARQSIYVISLVTTLLGMITSYTEISREFRIYAHERIKGLSPFAYFLSKWAWLAVAVGVLAPVMLLFFIVLVYRQPLPGFPTPRLGETITWLDQVVRFQLVGLMTRPASWLLLITLVLSCITSVTLGLLISAAGANSGRGYLYLSFMVVFIVLFSGLIRNARFEALIDNLSLFSTGKWAYAGIASSLNLYCWIDSWRFDEFNSTGHILSIWLSLGVFNLGAGLLAIALLYLRDPWRNPWTNLRLLLTRNLSVLFLITAILILLISYAGFFRGLSYEYHQLNYWNQSAYGGTNAYQYANIYQVERLSRDQWIIGRLSQSWCAQP